MYYYIIFLAIFVVGTILLAKTSSERHLILFLIRTQYGLKLIDRIANAAPELWKFLADFSTVISFGGIGAVYISKYRKLEPILFIIGIPALFLYREELIGLDILLSISLFFIFLIGLFTLQKLNNSTLYFLATTLLMGIITFKFLSLSPMISETITLYIAILTGCIGLPAFLIGTLVGNALEILTRQSTMPGVSPLLPSVRQGQPGFSFPGYDIFIPLKYAVIALITVLISHEFAHGVLARVHKMKLKSVGLLTLGVIPVGAFIEPDEEELKTRKSIERMRVFTAGSFSNLLVAVAAIAILTCITAPSISLVEYDSMEIVKTMPQTPASEVLKEGMLIYEVNGKPVTTYESFGDVMDEVTPMQKIVLTTNEGDLELETMAHPENSSRGYIGISFIQHMKNEWLYQTFFWIFFLSFNIALVNLLPIVPFDGGRMLKEVMTTFKINELTTEWVLRGVITLVLLVLLVNAFPLLDMFVRWIHGLFV